MAQFAALTKREHSLVLEVCGVGLPNGLASAPVLEEHVEAERLELMRRVRGDVRSC